ncbi:phage antirepressor KilAC domain-containing protein [Anaerococcus sp. AGMB00486]|uniref:Phage antirepressor KilAC domain-containing protein n=1 Tax=Anaerococcus faecalis TaxID=2742993 RepID=A0ABX2N7X1_9FIRM|nr:phage antirepressor KilAC domain-containing protein [Anaerococcus faecalis]NVF10790.1 phage antirepressor KilAC domain-containing protein [Anaerococcus faecalis]
MNNIKIFENNEFGKIRTIIDKNNEPWFVGKDIAEILEYRNGSRDINRHVDELDRKKEMVHDGNQLKETILINESGLYSLIFSSKMDKAREFKRWVTSEVLPSIRKQGIYMTEQKAKDILADPDSIIEIANQWKKAEARLALAQTKIEEDKPKVLFADAVSASSKSCLMGELAKLISQEAIRQGKSDKKIGQNNLFKWMRNKGYLCKGGERRNQPKQVFIEQGLFEMKKGSYIDSNGTNVVTTTTKITGKGQVYFVNKFLG